MYCIVAHINYVQKTLVLFFPETILGDNYKRFYKYIML